MPNLELIFNPTKAIKRADLIKMGKIISAKAMDKKIDMLIIKVSDDNPKGLNQIAFPFMIVDK